jgi:hypothetical protein
MTVLELRTLLEDFEDDAPIVIRSADLAVGSDVLDDAVVIDQSDYGSFSLARDHNKVVDSKNYIVLVSQYNSCYPVGA